MCSVSNPDPVDQTAPDKVALDEATLSHAVVNIRDGYVVALVPDVASAIAIFVSVELGEYGLWAVDGDARTRFEDKGILYVAGNHVWETDEHTVPIPISIGRCS